MTGQPIIVAAIPANEIDLELSVNDADGNLVEEVDDSFSGDIEGLLFVALPADGDYQINVSEFSSQAGSYVLAEQCQFYETGSLDSAEAVAQYPYPVRPIAASWPL